MPCSKDFAEKSEPSPLSLILRADTEAAHKDVERRLGLPDSILTLANYQTCLRNFYQLYRPLETQFLQFADWSIIGLDPPVCTLSRRLAVDLRALGVVIPDIPDAPATSLPPLRDFASALGACYVLEGSALGAQFMLPQLQKTLGNEMFVADAFFRGRGAETGSFWKRFRAALDLFGYTHPDQTSTVVSSAIDTFKSIGHWMQP
jgi:heme oxygenase